MTKTIERIEIPLSKRKMILMLIGSIGFVVIGLWLILNPPAISNPFFGNPTRLLILGIAAILIFGFFTFYFARRLPENKPGLILDKVGLTDNSSGVFVGQILWSDIENISVIEIQGQKLILLEVKNPHDYIEKQTSGLKKKIMQMNFNMYGTPLSITSNSLKIKFEELLNILNDRFDISRQ